MPQLDFYSYVVQISWILVFIPVYYIIYIKFLYTKLFLNIYIREESRILGSIAARQYLNRLFSLVYSSR